MHRASSLRSMRVAGGRRQQRCAPRRHYGPGKGGRLPGKQDKSNLETDRVVRGDGMVVTSGPFQPSNIRSEFPVLAAIDRDPTDPRIFLDGPGGTQVHGAVVDAMSDALINKMSNIGYDYTSSLNCLELVHTARTAGAAFFNCEGCEVVYGPTMTSLAFQLAGSLTQTLNPGDEVFLSRSEHEGNVSPWLRMAELAGATVRWIPLDPNTFTLRLDVLERMLASAEGKPRFLALGAASNATGTIHDVKRAVALAKAAGVDYTVVDAVHYAPHQMIDVQKWGCDFCLTSAYKWFGPHQSMMYGRKELLATLPTTKVRPATDELPTLESYELSRWEMGTLPFETIAGQLAAVEYIASLGTRFGGCELGAETRTALGAGFDVIATHEAALAQQFVAGLEGKRAARPHHLSRTDSCLQSINCAACSCLLLQSAHRRFLRGTFDRFALLCCVAMCCTQRSRV